VNFSGSFSSVEDEFAAVEGDHDGRQRTVRDGCEHVLLDVGSDSRQWNLDWHANL